MGHERSITILEFCNLEGIEERLYFELQAAGQGPEETFFGGTTIRISAEARRAWHRERRPSNLKGADKADYLAARNTLRIRLCQTAKSMDVYIKKFCSSAVLFRSSLRAGKPWFSENENRCYFTLKDLTEFLVEQQIEQQQGRQYLVRIIREMGGGNRSFNFHNKYSVSCFWIPFKKEDLQQVEEKECPV